MSDAGWELSGESDAGWELSDADVWVKFWTIRRIVTPAGEATVQFIAAGQLFQDRIFSHV